MLEMQGYKFSIVKPHADETCLIKDPKKNAKQVSLRKLKAVALKHPGELVLTADTIVVLKDHILGKPKDKKDALRMLKKLNNATHKVMTAFHLGIYDGKKLKTLCAEVVVSNVVFGDFKDADYTRYIATDEPMDKAGAYAVQGIGSKFIKRVDGSYTNVVGLPLFEVVQALSKAGVRPL